MKTVNTMSFYRIAASSRGSICHTGINPENDEVECDGCHNEDCVCTTTLAQFADDVVMHSI